MQTPSIANLRLIIGLYVLKSANEQPKLAGELIDKTEANLQKQGVQSPAKPVDVSGNTGSGRIIDIKA